MARWISAVFLEADDAARAIGALRDHGVHEEELSVLTGTGPGRDVEPAGERLAETRGALVERDEFVDVNVDDTPAPTDMNAATEARRGGVAREEHVVEAEGLGALTTTTPADAAKGAVGGGVVGLGIGLLAGAAALTLPGVGPVLAAGTLWAALGGAVGATAAGAAAGGVVGYLRDMGVPEKDAHEYHRAIDRGSVIVSVQRADNERGDDIADIFRKYHGSVIETP